MDLSIIIVSFNTKKLLKDCLNSIIKNTKGVRYEIIVIDNASKDGSAGMVEALSKEKQFIKLIKNKKNLGFGAANNQGTKSSSGRYLLLLNSDTKLHGNILPQMVSWMDNNPKVGISSCALFNKDGSMQGTGGYFPSLIRVFSWMVLRLVPGIDSIIKPFHPVKRLAKGIGSKIYANEMALDWVTGAFMLIRKSVIDDVGYFDEDYFMYTEEVDYCFRTKSAGWEIYYLPQWGITHYGGASGRSWGSVIPEFEGVKLFYKKHYPGWQYPILRFLLKIGAFLRIFIIGALKGKEAAKTYAKAFKVT